MFDHGDVSFILQLAIHYVRLTIMIHCARYPSIYSEHLFPTPRLFGCGPQKQVSFSFCIVLPSLHHTSIRCGASSHTVLYLILISYPHIWCMTLVVEKQRSRYGAWLGFDEWAFCILTGGAPPPMSFFLFSGLSLGSGSGSGSGGLEFVFHSAVSRCT